MTKKFCSDCRWYSYTDRSGLAHLCLNKQAGTISLITGSAFCTAERHDHGLPYPKCREAGHLWEASEEMAPAPTCIAGRAVCTDPTCAGTHHADDGTPCPISNCERRKPDRALWGLACGGCYFENPRHGTGSARSCDARRIDGKLVHVWAPDIPASIDCQGVPDRREPKREHVVRGPDRREVDAKQPVCWTCLLRGKRVEIENVTACSLRCPHQHESGQCAVHRAWVHKGDRRFADATRPEPGQERCKR